ncbi:MULTISPECIES: DUF58 domain-containing protein [unclassified Paenibacillus]|uniref:DUF58 domain-containing protein n=1 Tax=unclassified Paenibacillus TaxID=185978 RepID=UPI0004117A10|nr:MULTISPECIES: DUF58 domain-containing protein [unclassified Paenibacillus]KGP82115.1 hypothetical protein P364_0113745 [Paenibacillus sp. MAEPY2]KGP84780.1 hypothetical protein P363_0123085 [Paenibacillus sp. MAEPY1]
MSALGQRMLGAVLVVAFASFYVWHGGKAALFLSMIATLMLVSALSIHFFGPRNINIRRQMHANRVVAGERTTVAVELKFDCPIPLLWIILCENTPAGVHRKLLFPGTRRQFTYHYELSGLRRGVYRWESGKLYWGDIFGWNTASAETVNHTPLIVVPQAMEWGESAPGECSAIGEDALSERRSSQGNRSPEFREYQQGDPLGRVHWKSTAKTGRLQTFLPESSDSASLGILVYEGASGYEVKQSEKKDTPAFEHAVRAAARWIYTAERDNIPYQLWTEGGGSGSAHQEKWQQELLYSPESHELDKLAQARISTTLSITPSLRTEVLDTMAIGSRIVVLTGRMDDALVDWVMCATGLGYRVDVQLTDQTNRDVGNESLEQLRQRGVQIHWITDGSLPSMRKAEVTDVGA